MDNKRIFCSTKGKKKMFSWQTGRTNRVIWKYLLKKNYFVLSLPFSLFFKDVFLIKSSNDAAKTVITLKISEEKVVFLV